MTPMLNIGCGSSFHSDWINLDAAPVSPQVIAHDLRAGLPFPDDHFHAVYASHVLEHLPREPAQRLLGECLRVLKPGGIARIVVPDLETITRTYLQCLEGALRGDAESQARYDWMMLELYDQAVRTETGGQMAAYLEGALSSNQAGFVASRIGEEAVGRSAGRPSEASMVPRMSRLPDTSGLAPLAANLAILVIGSMYAMRFRAALTDVQRRNSINAWQLRQLVPTLARPR